MSVKQLPNGSWGYRFEVGKTQFRQQGFATRMKAKEVEVLKKAEAIRLRKGNPNFDDKIRLREAADRFFEEYSLPHVPRTAGVHITHIAAFKEFFGDRRIKEISPRDVVAFRRWVSETGQGIHGGKRTLHTVNHYHATLKAVINWAKKQRLFFGENPAWGVDMARVEKAKVRFLYPSEEKRLTPVVAKNAKLWPFYVMALHTGMRLGELMHLAVKDFSEYPEPMLFVSHTKTTRSRYVPLYGEAVELVKARIQGKGPQEPMLGAWNKTTVSEWFNEACKEAGVGDGFTFHCLRHTFAGHMLSRGVPIYKVSKILGHTTVVTTERHYGHLDKKVLADEIHHIGSLMSLPTVAKTASRPVSSGSEATLLERTGGVVNAPSTEGSIGR